MTECDCSKGSWCDHDLEDAMNTAERRGAAIERTRLADLLADKVCGECITAAPRHLECADYIEIADRLLKQEGEPNA